MAAVRKPRRESVAGLWSMVIDDLLVDDERGISTW